MLRKIKGFLLTIIFCSIPGFYLGWEARQKLSGPIEVVLRYFK